MAELAEYLSSPFVRRAFLGIVFIAVHAALTGAFATFRGAAFLISGAAHAALAGAALMLVIGGPLAAFNFSPMLGGAAAAVGLALWAAAGAERSSQRETDVLIGVGFAFAMALAVLLISLIPESAARVWGILLGDLLLLTQPDLWLLGLATAFVALCFAAFWNPFVFISFDIEGAKAFGLRAHSYNYLLFALMGFSTAALLKSVGAIVLFAMLVAPAATAKLIAHSARCVVIYAFFVALFSGLLALLISCYAHFSVSALAALLAASSYALTRGYLWLRERKAAAP